MTIPAPEEIQAELKGAFEVLQAAEAALAQGINHAAVSSAYFATFHAARAALWTRGRHSRTHRGIVHLFQQEFITTGLLKQDVLTILNEGRKSRHKADYDLIHFDMAAEKADQIVADARRFIERIETFLDE